MMNENMRDYALGCIEAGALGDALGYVIEFDTMKGIQHYYGFHGVQDLVTMRGRENALVSDDTQMTLFTAEGLALAAKHGADFNVDFYGELFREMTSVERPVLYWINEAYRDWLGTQGMKMPASPRTPIYKDPRLHQRRAPGNTCLNAMSSQYKDAEGEWSFCTVTDRANNSCGCGGVMRVAPLGIAYADPKEAFYMAAQAAALTHGHDLGFISAGLLADIISRILYQRENYENAGLKKVILDAMEDMKEMCGPESKVQEQVRLCEKAMTLAEEEGCDYLMVEDIGGGWVGQEAIADAIYAVVKYEHDFKKVMCVSVNHSGDSDSTGAIAGNILGAWYGREAIRREAFRWEILEMQDVYEDVVDRLLESVCG